MPKKVFRVAYFMNYIMQVAFSFLTPAGLLILGGWFLTNRWGAGRWVLTAAIVGGVLVGFYSMFYFLFKTMNHIDPTDQKGARRNDKATK